jgi:hypothetical protein
MVSLDGPAVGEDNLAQQDVESASQVVNCVPDDEAKTVRDRLADADAADVLSAIRIEFTSDEVRIALAKSFDFEPQILDMLIGPFNFSPAVF